MCTYSEINVENTGNCQGDGKSAVPLLMMKLLLQRLKGLFLSADGRSGPFYQH